MARSRNAQLVTHIDCPGGGQVWVDGHFLYVGHMRQPTGTTIIDVADPRSPKVVAGITIPSGWHSHKVRVANDLMIVNHERQGGEATAPLAAVLASTTFRILLSRDSSTNGAPTARACTGTISMGVTPISRRPSRVMSAISR